MRPSNGSPSIQTEEQWPILSAGYAKWRRLVVIRHFIVLEQRTTVVPRVLSNFWVIIII